MRMHHDMGGLPGEAIDRHEHDCAPWEKLVDAVFVLTSTKRPDLFRVDEMRRHIEALAPDVYDRLGYYERWVRAITSVMLERGVFTPQELEAKLAEVAARDG